MSPNFGLARNVVLYLRRHREPTGEFSSVCAWLKGFEPTADLQVLGALFSVDDLTGFEITKFLELPQPYGIFAVWGIVLPAIFLLSTTLTNLVLKDGLILRVSHDHIFKTRSISQQVKGCLIKGQFCSQFAYMCNP